MSHSNTGGNTTLRVGPARFCPGGVIRFGRYRSGETSIEVIAPNSESIWVATVALVPYGAPHPGEYGLWLKGWRENEGIPQALVEAGILTLTGHTFVTGFCEAQHAELTEHARSELTTHARPQTPSSLEKAHREIDALVLLQVYTLEHASRLKEQLTAEIVDQHIADGLSITDIIDLYSDLLGPR